MSDKKKTSKWTIAQILGFWFLLIALIFGWGGFYLGGVAADNSHKNIEAVKASAIQEASKELK